MIDRDERGNEIKGMSDAEVEALPLMDVKKLYAQPRVRVRRPRKHRHHFVLCPCWVSNFPK